MRGEEALLDLSITKNWVMDKAYNSQERVIDRILAAGGKMMMSARRNARGVRNYDQHLYKSRHLIENFFARLKQYRATATRYDKLAIHFLSAIYLA